MKAGDALLVTSFIHLKKEGYVPDRAVWNIYQLGRHAAFCRPRHKQADTDSGRRLHSNELAGTHRRLRINFSFACDGDLLRARLMGPAQA